MTYITFQPLTNKISLYKVTNLIKIYQNKVKKSIKTSYITRLKLSYKFFKTVIIKSELYVINTIIYS
jgi:hypothetical protein